MGCGKILGWILFKFFWAFGDLIMFSTDSASKLPQVLQYHPAIAISNGQEHYLFKADLPDWSPDDEVLATVARTVGVATAGELVDALLAPNHKDFNALRRAGFCNVRVEPIQQLTSRGSVNWDDSII